MFCDLSRPATRSRSTGGQPVVVEQSSALQALGTGAKELFPKTRLTVSRRRTRPCLKRTPATDRLFAVDEKTSAQMLSVSFARKSHSASGTCRNRLFCKFFYTPLNFCRVSHRAARREIAQPARNRHFGCCTVLIGVNCGYEEFSGFTAGFL